MFGFHTRRIPEPVRGLGGLLLDQIADLDGKSGGLDKDLRATTRQDEEASRLMTIPGVGAVHRDAAAGFRASDAELPARTRFRRLGRPRAATAHDWRKAEAGQDIEDGPARSQTAPDHGCHGGDPVGYPARDAGRIVAGTDACAQATEAGGRGLANKMARIVWALMTKKETYRHPGTAAA